MSTQAMTRYGRLATPISFPGYVMSPNGGQVFYVDSGGVRDETDANIAKQLFTTLGGALAACRANRGDQIIVLPQHAENVTTTPTFVAGVRITGIGNGDERPTFSWTATTSQWAITVANVWIENCILNMAATAATTVTKAFTTSGARTVLANNRILCGVGASQLVTTAMEFTTGADRGYFVSNDVFSNAASANTDIIKLTNAVDRFTMMDNVMTCGMTSATSSLVTMTTAPTNIYIGFNSFSNTITSSTKALVGISAATGVVEYNNLYLTNASGGATAIGTLGSMGFIQNFGCATNGSGLLTPAAGT